MSKHSNRLYPNHFVYVKYFDMPASVDVTAGDGRAFLAAADGKYDVILVDAYQDITIPFQMSSKEFFSLVRAHLAPGGVMAVNMNMHADGDGSINQALTDTVSAVFPGVWSVDVPDTTNRELFASADTRLPAALAENIPGLADGALRGLMEKAASGLTPCTSGDRVLTDDRAPVELLGMKALDGYIGGELGYYKKLYREQGLAAVLRALG